MIQTLTHTHTHTHRVSVPEVVMLHVRSSVFVQRYLGLVVEANVDSGHISAHKTDVKSVQSFNVMCCIETKVLDRRAAKQECTQNQVNKTELYTHMRWGT